MFYVLPSGKRWERIWGEIPLVPWGFRPFLPENVAELADFSQGKIHHDGAMMFDFLGPLMPIRGLSAFTIADLDHVLYLYRLIGNVQLRTDHSEVRIIQRIKKQISINI